jgi:hypothetical protein
VLAERLCKSLSRRLLTPEGASWEGQGDCLGDCLLGCCEVARTGGELEGGRHDGQGEAEPGGAQRYLIKRGIRLGIVGVDDGLPGEEGNLGGEEHFGKFGSKQVVIDQTRSWVRGVDARGRGLLGGVMAEQ